MLLCLCPPLSSCTNTEPSLTPHNLTTALDTLPDSVWYDFGRLINVPPSKRGKIRSQYSSDGERKSALLHTYLTSHPAPSWQHITHALYRYDEGKHHAVLERVQRMFPTGDQYHGYAHLHTCIYVRDRCKIRTVLKPSDGFEAGQTAAKRARRLRSRPDGFTTFH